MRIALDYDDTYTNDPRFWDSFIFFCEMFGHEVMIVTYRDSGLPINHTPACKVFYTGFKAKRKFMEDQELPIDVFIDDSPETILRDSDWTDEDRKLWKEKNHKNIA